MIGETISHYKILDKLGEGGMGVVYKAEDTKLQRVVALKFLSSAIHASSEDFARFRQEAIAISALNHPNIATLFDFDESGNKHFIVLEYIPGGTLKNKIAESKNLNIEIPIDEIITYGIQMAEGLAHAHRRLIVHRDIKPDNVMLSEEGNLKITDFSLALLSGVSNLTRTGSTVGTAAYMSPEQIIGEEIDHRTDIFSLGILLYELTTFRRPFRGEHEAALAYSTVHEEPRALSDYRKDVPEQLSRVIFKCLEKDREQRYQKVEDIVSDLKAKESVQQQVQKPVIEETIVIPKRPRKMPLIWGSLAFVVVAVGFYFFLKSSPLLSENHKVVAVLPFTNMSGNADDEYFCDGMTEDILTQIGKIGELKVISRTTMMHYKKTSKTIREIGKELNAGVVLEGSIRHIANQIRVTAQLIDAETDEHLWSETYDKDFTQVFEIQSDVAFKIASALQATLTPGEQHTIEKKPTENTVAYNYYLRGNEYLKRTTKADNETAIGFYNKALELDKQYSDAWSGLSSGYLRGAYLFNYGYHWLDSAKTASEKALALDGNSAEALNALASVYMIRGLYDTALVYFKKAIEYDPSYFSVMQNIGQIYFYKGSLDDAMVWLKRAVALGPTEAGPRTDISRIYISIGAYDKAEVWLKSALELDPNSSYNQLNLANIYVYKNKYPEGLELIKKIVNANPEDASLLGWCATVAEMVGNDSLATRLYETSIKLSSQAEPDPNNISYIGLGRILLKKGKTKDGNDYLNKAEKVYRNQIQNGNKSPDMYYNLASVNSIRGNKEEALKNLKQSIEYGFRDYYIALSDNTLDNLKTDPGFHQIMASIKSQIDVYKLSIEKLDR